ncbi:MAG: hypothetical protein AB7E32_14000 [Desulfovibrio sp.]
MRLCKEIKGVCVREDSFSFCRIKTSHSKAFDRVENFFSLRLPSGRTILP